MAPTAVTSPAVEEGFQQASAFPAQQEMAAPESTPVAASLAGERPQFTGTPVCGLDDFWGGMGEASQEGRTDWDMLIGDPTAAMTAGSAVAAAPSATMTTDDCYTDDTPMTAGTGSAVFSNGGRGSGVYGTAERADVVSSFLVGGNGGRGFSRDGSSVIMGNGENESAKRCSGSGEEEFQLIAGCNSYEVDKAPLETDELVDMPDLGGLAELLSEPGLVRTPSFGANNVHNSWAKLSAGGAEGSLEVECSESAVIERPAVEFEGATQQPLSEMDQIALSDRIGGAFVPRKLTY